MCFIPHCLSVIRYPQLKGRKINKWLCTILPIYLIFQVTFYPFFFNLLRGNISGFYYTLEAARQKKTSKKQNPKSPTFLYQMFVFGGGREECLRCN